MRDGTYYLNNNGSRWVVYTDGKKDQFVLITPDGKQEKRTALYYEMFGNFAVVCFSYKGEKRKAFFDDFERIDGLPVVSLKTTSQTIIKEATN